MDADLELDGPPLALLLLRGSRFFDRQLLPELQRRGFPLLSPAQSLVFGHLDVSGTSPSELARRLGSTRQATSDLLAGLQRLGLVRVVDDPSRRRGRLVCLTDAGQALSREAGEHLQRLEDQLDPQVLRQVRAGLLALALDYPAPRELPLTPEKR